MNILVMVNHGPREIPIANAALRFVQAARRSGHTIAAVFFHGNGVDTAMAGSTPAGPLLCEWEALAEQGLPLLLCSTASFLRFGVPGDGQVSGKFSSAGLVKMWDLATRSDRVVTF